MDNSVADPIHKQNRAVLHSPKCDISLTIMAPTQKSKPASNPASSSAPTHEISNVTLHLSDPVDLEMQWVGRPELMSQVLAAWFQVHPDDFPLAPRLVGKPGVGKTTLAYAAGKAMDQEVYFFQATMDTRPEDLIVTPVVAEAGKLKYVASPLVTAMIRGGIVVVDEGNRMSEKSWASLAPLLDQRRYVESLVAGIRIPADGAFRFCATMNDDASTFDLPEYIHSRLQPQIFIDFPEADEERVILKYNLPYAPDQVVEYVVRFLQVAHHLGEPYTVRDGINVARYALKLMGAKRSIGGDTKDGPGSTSEETSAPQRKALTQAIRMILGEEATEHLDHRGD